MMDGWIEDTRKDGVPGVLTQSVHLPLCDHLTQWTQTEPEYRGWVRAMHALVLATQRLMAPVSRRGGDRLLDWCVSFIQLVLSNMSGVRGWGFVHSLLD